MVKKNKVSFRQQEVLHLLAKGLTAKEIAHLLYISTETVHSHRSALIANLEAKNTAHLISKSYEEGYLMITGNF